MSKLEEFIKRNRKRNAKLYKSGLIEGEDYIICPVSNERLRIIKSTYITNVLGMTVEDFWKHYPTTQRVCRKRSETISNALKQIDEETGLTKHKLSTVKAKETLSKIGKDGLSGYKRKGQKTRSTHMSNIDRYGKNGYSRLATKAIVKGNLTKAKKGLILDPTIRDEYYRYKRIIIYLTDKQKGNLTEGYITGLAGKDGAWQVDHNFSIMHGYKNKISPFVIAHKNNLQMLPWKDNLSKHAKSGITIEQLYNITGYTEDKSISEFTQMMKIINEEIKNKMPVSSAKVLEKYYDSKL